MKKWQIECNYRRVKDENGNVTAYIITVDGEDVEVTKDVYIAYTSIDRRERYVENEVEPGRKLSLEKLVEDAVPLEDLGVRHAPSAEDLVLYIAEEAERKQQLSCLTAALSSLDEEERQLLQALFFDHMSAREYARQLGVYHRTILYRRDKLLEKLRRKIFS